MNRDEIKQIARDYICQQILSGVDPSELTDDTALVSDGILDSLASLKLVSFLEERFGISIAAHEVDVDHLDNMNLIADTVLSKLG